MVSPRRSCNRPTHSHSSLEHILLSGCPASPVSLSTPYQPFTPPSPVPLQWYTSLPGLQSGAQDIVSCVTSPGMLMKAHIVLGEGAESCASTIFPSSMVNKRTPRWTDQITQMTPTRAVRRRERRLPHFLLVGLRSLSVSTAFPLLPLGNDSCLFLISERSFVVILYMLAISLKLSSRISSVFTQRCASNGTPKSPGT